MLSMNLKDPVYIPVIMMSLGRMEDNRMQKAFFLLVCLALVACGTNEENQSTTQESMFNYLRMSDGGFLSLIHI